MGVGRRRRWRGARERRGRIVCNAWCVAKDRWNGHFRRGGSYTQCGKVTPGPSCCRHSSYVSSRPHLGVAGSPLLGSSARRAGWGRRSSFRRLAGMILSGAVGLERHLDRGVLQGTLRAVPPGVTGDQTMQAVQAPVRPMSGFGRRELCGAGAPEHFHLDQTLHSPFPPYILQATMVMKASQFLTIVIIRVS